jgi:hypothetical protein
MEPIEDWMNKHKEEWNYHIQEWQKLELFGTSEITPQNVEESEENLVIFGITYSLSLSLHKQRDSKITRRHNKNMFIIILFKLVWGNEQVDLLVWLVHENCISAALVKK